MPEEPDNSIEAQVKAYAEARRQAAGEPLELHPATRHMLQAEVARTLKAKRPLQKSQSIWAGLWLRLALAGGVAACGTLALVVFFRGDKGSVAQFASQTEPAVNQTEPQSSTSGRGSVAKDARADQQTGASREISEMATPPTPLASTTPMPGPSVTDEALHKQSAPAASAPAGAVQADAVVESIESKTQSMKALKSDFADAKPSEASAPMTRSGGVLANKSEANATASGGKLGTDHPVIARAMREPSGTPAKPNLAMAQPASAPEVPAEVSRSQLTAGLEMAKAKDIPGARFVQITPPAAYRRNINSPPLPQVLQSFEFRQEGSTIRIVDTDGSIYSGKVLVADSDTTPTADQSLTQSATEPARRMRGIRKSSPAITDKYNAATSIRQGVETQKVLFQVTGTNRSLNQIVVFTGNAQPAPLQPASILDQTAVISQSKMPAKGESPVFLRIQGRATIGQSSQIPVEAIPEKH